MRKILFSAALIFPNLLSNLHAQNLDDIAAFAAHICDKIDLTGSITRQKIEGEISGDIAGLAKVLGASVNADGTLIIDNEEYQGLSYNDIPEQMNSSRQCRKEIALKLTSDLIENKTDKYVQSEFSDSYTLDLSDRDVGSTFIEFGQDAIVKLSRSGNKYIGVRKNGGSIKIDNLPNTKNYKMTFLVHMPPVRGDHRKRDFVFTLNNSDKITPYLDVAPLSGAIAIAEFQGAKFQSKWGAYLDWDFDDQNTITFTVKNGDFTMLVNNQFINSYYLDNKKIFSLTITGMTTYDGITAIDIVEY